MFVNHIWTSRQTSDNWNGWQNVEQQPILWTNWKVSSNVEKIDLCEFESFYDVPLLNELPAEIVEDLPADLKYLYKTVISLIQGKMEDDLMNKKNWTLLSM